MRNHWLKIPAAMGVIGLTSAAIAADHADGPAATMDPAADITDVYAWVSPDGARTYLVMNVFPFARAVATDTAALSKFSNAVQYVFHTRSLAAYGSTLVVPLNIICTFDAAQVVSCWAGAEYAHGDASSATSPLSSADGRFRVFAGLRDDSFFFNLTGFQKTEQTVIAAKAGLTFDTNGCPLLNAPTSALLVSQLSTDPASDGGPARNTLAGANVLSLAIEIDTALVTTGGPILGLWASTNRAPTL